jgi:hypothetical protein
MTGNLRDTVAAKRADLEKAPPVDAGAFETVRRNTSVLQIIGLPPSDPKSHAVVAVADRYGLDPVLGHIMILGTSKLPYITRDGYLHIAHKSGQLDGIEVVDGPRRDGSEWVATVAVYRKDMGRPFTFPGRADLGRDNGPEMALARAERRALKRAFAVTLPREFAEDEWDTRATVPLEASPPPDMQAPDDPGSSAVPEQEAGGGDLFDQPIGQKDRAALMAAFDTAGIPDRPTRLQTASQILNREIRSFADSNPDRPTIAESAEIMARLAEERQDKDLGRQQELGGGDAATDAPR